MNLLIVPHHVYLLTVIAFLAAGGGDWNAGATSSEWNERAAGGDSWNDGGAQGSAAPEANGGVQPSATNVTGDDFKCRR